MGSLAWKRESRQVQREAGRLPLSPVIAIPHLRTEKISTVLVSQIRPWRPRKVHFCAKGKVAFGKRESAL